MVAKNGRVSALAFTIAAGLFASGSPTAAAYPGTNGKIIFQSNRVSPDDQFTMNSDGTNQTRVTFGANDWYACWSPDGQSFAFASGKTGDFEVYTARADGSGVTQITSVFGIDFDPSWSPDGMKLVFESQRDEPFRELYVMNADGSNVTRLTFNPLADVRAAWSPLGDKIAFVRGGVSLATNEIYVMSADGSGQTNLTNNVTNDFWPAWSPDGSKIAFYSDRSGNLEVYVMDADGSNVTQLTFNPALDGQPAWSPDGTKIAFTSTRDGNAEIYVMNADGSGQTRLTFNLATDSAPDWQPISGEADLSVAKTDSPDPIAVGKQLTYDILVTNSGPSDATTVMVADALPDSAAFEAAGAGCTYAGATHTVTCAVGSLASGASTTLTIVARPVLGGTIVNEVTVTADQPDPNVSDNVATASTTVNGPPNTPPACDRLPPQAPPPPVCP
jgi:uncharacterized repeat protein (TIGR01451 family)